MTPDWRLDHIERHLDRLDHRLSEQMQILIRLDVRSETPRPRTGLLRRLDRIEERLDAVEKGLAGRDDEAVSKP